MPTMSSLVAHTSGNEEGIPQGATVLIVSTPNVQSRLPDMIGKLGIVKQVPTHPNTWFRVSVGDQVSIGRDLLGPA